MAARTDAAVQRIDSLPGTDVTQPGDGTGDVREVPFYSKALGRTDSYLIYLPPDYQSMASSGTHFPVVYMLHGGETTAPTVPCISSRAARWGRPRAVCTRAAGSSRR